MKYLNKNTIHEMDDLHEQSAAFKTKRELDKIREKAIESIPRLQEIDTMNQLINTDPNNLGRDPVAENSFEGVATFNSDMKTLALNAYQLGTLMNLVLDEHHALNEWLAEVELITLRTETAVYGCAYKVKGFY